MARENFEAYAAEPHARFDEMQSITGGESEGKGIENPSDAVKGRKGESKVVGPDSVQAFPDGPKVLNMGRGGAQVDLGLIVKATGLEGQAAGKRQRAVFSTIDAQTVQRPPTSGSARGRGV